MQKSDEATTVSAETPVDPTCLDAARAATASALPFTELLQQRFSTMVESLRFGDDSDALSKLGDSSRDLEDFFQFIILVGDMTRGHQSLAPLHEELAAYRGRLLDALESLNPALNDLDLVEVADILENDVISTLEEYRNLHEQMTQTLLAA